MNTVELRPFIQELKSFHVPSDMASIRHDLEIFHRGNEASLLFLEISLIGKWQIGLCLLEHIQRKFGRSFALRMEVSFQRSRLLSLCRAFIEDQMTGYGEGSSHRRNGLNELTSC